MDSPSPPPSPYPPVCEGSATRAPEISEVGMEVTDRFLQGMEMKGKGSLSSSSSEEVSLQRVVDVGGNGLRR